MTSEEFGKRDPFRAVFECALDAILIVDDERRYVDANPAAAELLNAPREEVLGTRIDDYSTHDRVSIEAMWTEFRRSGHLDGEFDLRRRDGTIRVTQFRARADFLPGRHLSILRDVTQMRHRVHREADARREALVGISHDLKSPLQAAKFGLQTLVEALSDPELRRIARHIERSVSNVDELAERLHRLSRTDLLGE